MPMVHESATVSLLRRRRLWLGALGAATVVALLFAAEQYLFRSALDQPGRIPMLVVSQLARWFLWLVAAPVLYLLVRHHQAGGRLRALAWTGGMSAAALGIALLHALATAGIDRVLDAGPGVRTLPLLDHVAALLTVDVLVSGLIVAFSLAKVNADRLRQRERRASQLAAQLAQTRLAMLRMQLRPHFLFNALNSVASLMHSDVRAADAMLTALSDLLRATLLAEGRQEVPLSRELELVERYLDIMRIRFGDRINARLEIEPGSRGALVPSFLLQPLVENAIRHGMQESMEPRHLVIRARRDRDDLLIHVLNDGAALPAGWAERHHAGLGLRMTRERLRVLYGERHRLELANRAEGGVQLALAIPFRYDEPSLPAA